jgi:CRISPR-associated endonuclease Cas2
MATVNEGLLRFGNWIVMYDLGASALTNSYGTHATAYRQVTDALTSSGFVMVQQSVYRHPTGCTLLHAGRPGIS